MKSEVKQKPRSSAKRRPNGGKGRKRIPGMTRLSAKNQITLPVETVRKAGLVPGVELTVDVDSKGRIIVTELVTGDWIDEVAGGLTGVYGPNALEEQRRGDREREIALGLIVEDDE